MCVVLGHLGYVSPSLIFNRNRYAAHTLTWSDVFNFYGIILSVPIFFIIACYLMAKRPRDRAYLWAYLKRIGKLTVFWVILLKVFQSSGWDIVDLLPTDLSGLFAFVLSGGRSLYYFFVSLILLTIIVYCSKRLATTWIVILFVLSTVILTALPVVSLWTGWFRLSIFWNPLNFFPYPFAAILIWRWVQSDRPTRSWVGLIVGLAVLSAGSAVLDWTVLVDKGFFNIQRYALPGFARPALVFIAMAMLLLAIRLPLKPLAPVTFMAKYSLALYCLHPFFIEVGGNLGRRIGVGQQLFALVISVLLSYAAVLILKGFLNKDLLP